MMHSENSATFSREEIIERIRIALPLSVREYEMISGQPPRLIPEAWIATDIAKALGKNTSLRVVPEASMRDIGIPTRGKIDLVIYDRDRLFPQCLIEIKGHKSLWRSVASDCERIRLILQHHPKIEFGLFVYVSGEMAQINDENRTEIARHKRTLIQWAKVDAERMIDAGRHECLGDDLIGRHWFAIILQIDRPQT
jgi:hypothetical protein